MKVVRWILLILISVTWIFVGGAFIAMILDNIHRCGWPIKGLTDFMDVCFMYIPMMIFVLMGYAIILFAIIQIGPNREHSGMFVSFFIIGLLVINVMIHGLWNTVGDSAFWWMHSYNILIGMIASLPRSVILGEKSIFSLR